MMSTMSAQKGSSSSQMIPTPGFSNSNNVDSTNLTHGFSSEKSVMQLQSQQPQNQHVGSQNNGILHTYDSQFGKQHNQFGYTNNGLGMLATNMQNVNVPGSSDGYLNVTYVSLSKPSPLQFDQSQQSLMQGSSTSLLHLFILTSTSCSSALFLMSKSVDASFLTT